MNLRLPGVSLNLESAASVIFAAVGARGWEQRQSSHYPEDRYLRSVVEGFNIYLALSDEVLEGYPLMLWITTLPEVPQNDTTNFELKIETRLRAVGVEVSR